MQLTLLHHAPGMPSMAEITQIQIEPEKDYITLLDLAEELLLQGLPLRLEVGSTMRLCLSQEDSIPAIDETHKEGPPILYFVHEYGFLDTFYHRSFSWKERVWQTSEHAFQAMKTHNSYEYRRIAMAPSPGIAKARGRACTLRKDWDAIKDQIMLDVLRAKFSDPIMRDALLNTGDRHLEEGNFHGDTYWGTVQGEGRNQLGKTLMQLRDELKGAE